MGKIIHFRVVRGSHLGSGHTSLLYHVLFFYCSTTQVVNLNFIVFYFLQVILLIISSFFFSLSFHRSGESVPSPLQGELRQHGIVLAEEKGATAAAESAGRKEEGSTAVERGSEEKQDGEWKRRRFSETQHRELGPGKDFVLFFFLYMT